MKKLFPVILITLIGAWLRFVNISPFKIYPDTYVNLITALNISDYGSVVGFLGDAGMVYPDFFMWTRPFFALTLLVVNFFTGDLNTAGVYISFAASVLTLPLIFVLLKKIFQNNNTALGGTVIGALSFNHIVWSGFVQTEALGVFLMTVFLVLLFSNLKRKPEPADFWDVSTGVALVAAVLCRYEYILVAIPAALLLFNSTEKNSKKSPLMRQIKLINILASFLLVGSVAFSQLYPVPGTFRVFSEQLSSLLKIAGGLSVAVFVLFFLRINFRLSVWNHIVQRAELFTVISIWFMAVLMIFNYLGILPNQLLILSGYADFFSTDFVPGIFVLIGITFWWKSKTSNPGIVFALISIALLAPIYYRVNPDMARYLVHLLPFFLIIASYGLGRVFLYTRNFQPKSLAPMALTAVFLPFLIQGILSFQGIRQLDQGAWFKTGYEEESALLFKERTKTYGLKIDDPLVIASFPEPYFFVTRFSTYSLADQYPYIYIDDSMNSHEVLLIQDMGMHDIFPSFSVLIDKKLQDFLVDDYLVGIDYRYGNYSKPEAYPVRVFKLTLGQLKAIIFSAQDASSR